MNTKLISVVTARPFKREDEPASRAAFKQLVRVTLCIFLASSLLVACASTRGPSTQTDTMEETERDTAVERDTVIAPSIGIGAIGFF